jgi:hypothetical protein
MMSAVGKHGRDPYPANTDIMIKPIRSRMRELPSPGVLIPTARLADPDTSGYKGDSFSARMV